MPRRAGRDVLREARTKIGLASIRREFRPYIGQQELATVEGSAGWLPTLWTVCAWHMPCGNQRAVQHVRSLNPRSSAALSHFRWSPPRRGGTNATSNLHRRTHGEHHQGSDDERRVRVRWCRRGRRNRRTRRPRLLKRRSWPNLRPGAGHIRNSGSGDYSTFTETAAPGVPQTTRYPGPPAGTTS